MRMHDRAGARQSVCVVCVAAVLGIADNACAQQYPARPIRMVVASTAGSAPDVLARIIGQKFNEAWGQPVIIDNRAGGSSTIGMLTVAKATPDGYTLLMAATIISTVPATSRNPSYDPVRDFTAISRVAAVPLILVVNPSMGVRDVNGLIALAKGKPGQFNYGTPGAGSLQHLVAELFGRASGVRMVHVPYKSGSLAVTAVIGGEVQLFFAGMPPALPQVRAGRLRALAVTTAKRFESTPDVPTMAEAGLAGFEVDNWHGLVGPPGMPAAVVKKISAEVERIVGLSDIRARFIDVGGEPQASTPAAFRELIRAETVRWTKIATEIGITVD